MANEPAREGEPGAEDFEFHTEEGRHHSEMADKHDHLRAMLSRGGYTNTNQRRSENKAEDHEMASDLHDLTSEMHEVGSNPETAHRLSNIADHMSKRLGVTGYNVPKKAPSVGEAVRSAVDAAEDVSRVGKPLNAAQRKAFSKMPIKSHED